MKRILNKENSGYFFYYFCKKIMIIITRTRIFLIGFTSFLLLVFFPFAIYSNDFFTNKLFQMFFWTPTFIYFLIQCYIFYLGKKTNIKKVKITALINLIIAFLICISFVLFFAFVMALNSGLGRIG
ncbi:hypothetical protein ASE21_04280 [Flavobacterium sp. Root901]|nr:hypothetical protein ASE21_04280 [Flavobacterium sp. Root901]